MKNKYKYIIITFVTILCGSIISCSDFLNEDARGLLTPDTFFTNEAEVTLALNKLTNDLGAAGFLEHLGTDVGNSGRIPLSAAGRFGAYEYFPDTGRVNNTWSGYYTTVRDANVFLASIERADLDDEVKGNAIAQLLFFRAYVYLKLVVTFGDVPYWRNDLTNIEEVSLLGKTDSKEILNDMVADLEQAISSGYMSTDRWNEYEGRPTVWAARMLKAHCHVWLAKDDAQHWANAKVELLEITANSPHELNDDYADMYRAGNEFHQEIIFGSLRKADVKGANIVSSRYRRQSENGPTRTAMTELGISTGASQINLRRSFAATYDDNDIRKLYNVWETETLANGNEAVFNWVYIPKIQGGPVPVADPLHAEAENVRQSSQPDRIFVLADAYLLLAETEFMMNGSTTVALNAINEVRSMERTGLDQYAAITIEDIRNERAWELVHESYWGRKKDLVRWGILESTVIAIPAAEIAAGANDTAISYAEAEAAIISDAPIGKYHVLPIPLSEIEQSRDIGGALTQNPLWE